MLMLSPADDRYPKLIFYLFLTITLSCLTLRLQFVTNQQRTNKGYSNGSFSVVLLIQQSLISREEM